MTAIPGVIVLLSYLVGAIPFGYAVARWRGVDIFRQGSGNIGATNVGRVLGKRFGILVFVLDFAKGAMPVTAARWLTPESDLVTEALGVDGMPVLTGLAAVLGHMFPVYLRFRGGKGVATGAGVVVMLLPGPALGAFATWCVVVGLSRYVSLASLVAALSLCVLRLVFTPQPFAPEQRTLTAFCFLAAFLVFARHRANIVRLLQGTENQVQGIPTMTFAKTLHVLALGLWFGSSVFFTLVVAPVLFQKFEALGANPDAAERGWLPLTPDFNKEQGTRLAGTAVSPLFPWFFLVQGVCGLVVALTAWGWARGNATSGVHRLRCLLALIALATVVAGWPLAEKVSQLRVERYSAEAVAAAGARAAFGAWHLYSLLLNFGTLLLVTALMALAAHLPQTNHASTT